MMRALPLLLLASCAALEPDYVEASPFYSDTGYGFDDPRALGFDGETVGVMVTVGWAVGQMGEAYRNLSMLDVSKGGELTMRDGSDVTVNVEDDEPEAAPVEDDQEWSKPPKSMDEAWAYLIWAAAVVLLGFGAKKWGIPALRLYRTGKK